MVGVFLMELLWLDDGASIGKLLMELVVAVDDGASIGKLLMELVVAVDDGASIGKPSWNLLWQSTEPQLVSSSWNLLWQSTEPQLVSPHGTCCGSRRWSLNW